VYVPIFVFLPSELQSCNNLIYATVLTIDCKKNVSKQQSFLYAKFSDPVLLICVGPECFKPSLYLAMLDKYTKQESKVFQCWNSFTAELLTCALVSRGSC
jgi:hypothetical protein